MDVEGRMGIDPLRLARQCLAADLNCLLVVADLHVGLRDECQLVR